jgi:hypothetical protein
MVCSLNFFLDYFEAGSSHERDLIIRRYKKSQSGEAKGRSIYYTPSLRAIKGTLCPEGTLEEKISAIEEACIRPAWTGSANEARVQSNVRVFKTFRSVYGNKDLNLFPSPRMQFLASKDVAINLQPDVFFEMDDETFMLKLGLSKSPRSENAVRVLLQAFGRAARRRELKIPISRIQFLDTISGDSYVEENEDLELESDLLGITNDLNYRWNLS